MSLDRMLALVFKTDIQSLPPPKATKSTTYPNKFGTYVLYHRVLCVLIFRFLCMLALISIPLQIGHQEELCPSSICIPQSNVQAMSNTKSPSLSLKTQAVMVYTFLKKLLSGSPR